MAKFSELLVSDPLTSDLHLKYWCFFSWSLRVEGFSCPLPPTEISSVRLHPVNLDNNWLRISSLFHFHTTQLPVASQIWDNITQDRVQIVGHWPRPGSVLTYPFRIYFICSYSCFFLSLTWREFSKVHPFKLPLSLHMYFLSPSLFSLFGYIFSLSLPPFYMYYVLFISHTPPPHPPFVLRLFHIEANHERFSFVNLLFHLVCAMMPNFLFGSFYLNVPKKIPICIANVICWTVNRGYWLEGSVSSASVFHTMANPMKGTLFCNLQFHLSEE